MKQIVCEMCGSSDLVKQDGVFVCQHCGAKYSVEEARKLMIEGGVDVSGSTVIVDRSGELANLYQIARSSRDNQNYANAEKFYGQILVLDPTSWEAAFYTTYSQSMNYKKEGISVSANRLRNCESSVLNLIINTHYTAEERRQCVKEVGEKLAEISNSFYIDILAHAFEYEHIDVMSLSAAEMVYQYGDLVIQLFGDEYGIDIAVPCWEKGTMLARAYPEKGHVNEYIEKIRRFNPDYQMPSDKKGGCYIATAVYGSYDCPQVWTLRRYRDNTLAETWYGRAFIRFYYAISPTLVSWFGERKWFKQLWKGKLDYMVERLKRNGVKDTPYDDRKW